MNKMRAIHPGEHLREDYLIPLGMSANALAIALSVPSTRINDIVREKRGITPDTALRLAKCFNTTPQYWLNWQNDYDLKTTKSNTIENIKQCKMTESEFYDKINRARKQKPIKMSREELFNLLRD